MIKNLGHAGTHRRVALNVGSGFVPGLKNSVLMGAAIAGGRLGWEIVGIRDGFEGLLHPEHSPTAESSPSAPSELRVSIPQPEASSARRLRSIRSIPPLRAERRSTCPTRS